MSIANPGIDATRAKAFSISPPEPTSEASAWSVVATRLEAFVAAWEAGGDPPAVREHLPAGPDDVRRLVLVELIKADLEYRWGPRDCPQPIDAYLADHPELGAVPAELLYEEYHLRARRGPAPDVGDYFRRFPQAADALGRLLGCGEATVRASAGANALAALAPGATLGDFLLLRDVGRGSFARVFLACQSSMGRLVALKVAPAGGAEPRMLARLEHPQIVRVYDERRDPASGLALLYMSYVPGGSLAEAAARLAQAPERSGQALLDAIDAALTTASAAVPSDSALRARLARMTWPAAVAWLGARLAEALAHAHGRGVVHRDVKPANVLLSAEGLPQLVDFNVGAVALESDAGAVGGSLGYMAPEHLDAFANPAGAAPLDARADVFSLGVTLWELLAGAAPFPTDLANGDRAGIVARLARERRAGVTSGVRAAAQRAGTPELVATLERCLAARPEDRPTADALARALELCLHPRAQRLLALRPTGWAASLRRWPAAALAVLGAAPNLVASAFNVAYNHAAVIVRFPETETAFAWLLLAINAVFFPIGIGWVLKRTRTANQGVARLACEEALSASEAARVRRQAWDGPTSASLAVAVCWGLAGVAWPAALEMLSGRLPWEARLHFLASLAMCGVMAAAYTFFLLACALVRAQAPALWQAAPLAPSDLPPLGRLRRRLTTHLVLAFAAPMLGVAILSFLPSPTDAARFALRALSVAGGLGALASLAAERMLRADLDALQKTFAPDASTSQG